MSAHPVSPAPGRAASTSVTVTPRGIFAAVFGVILGMAILKFGNPVILDHQIEAPKDFAEALTVSWPAQWGQIAVFAASLAGGLLYLLDPSSRGLRPARILWLAPLLWFGWQCIAAARTVDAGLSGPTLVHFAACLVCYLAGLFLLGRKGSPPLLLLVLLGAFLVCLVKGANQHQVEFKRDRQTLVDGERTRWREFPTEVVEQMKRESLILRTNGVDIANPIILLKLQRGRIHGTLVYPNALAGAILLLLPVTLAWTVFGTGELRPAIRRVLIALVTFLGLGCLFWTGSKSGWLIALAVIGFRLFQFPIPRRTRIAVLAAVASLGLLAFGIRFHSYFSAGATSVGARFDYWRAAVTTAATHPATGTGPGTFQRPYARIKSPTAEMARLVHNDYLEQFSDSGIPGGLLYLTWIGTLIVAVGRHAMNLGKPIFQAMALGVLAWLAQGFVEFGLYIPALSWTAFTLAGILAAVPVQPRKPFESSSCLD